MRSESKAGPGHRGCINVGDELGSGPRVYWSMVSKVTKVSDLHF